MKLTLTDDMFTNNVYTVYYGDREAVFTIVDEEFKGNNRLGRINRVLIAIHDLKTREGWSGPAIIGMGDGRAGIYPIDPLLKGQVFNKDNMNRCVVDLVEV